MQKKSQSSGDFNPGHVQSRHVPREPHTNQDEVPFCILLYFYVYVRILCSYPQILYFYLAIDDASSYRITMPDRIYLIS